MDVRGVRRAYEREALDEGSVPQDPMELFGKWLQDALSAEVLEPTAMTLATVGEQGQPSARMVLLKGFGPRGFSFYSNYASRKGRELAGNPRAALVFWWDQLERQVRVEGTVVRLEREESAEYFRSRPRGSQLGAFASPQSQPIASREELAALVRQVSLRYPEGEVPLPENWGGYLVRPAAIEFWQGRPDRLHDRFLYTLESDGAWQWQRLAP